MNPITLRSYQERAVDALLQVQRGIVHSPAGSGKTIIGAAALSRWIERARRENSLRWYRILWLANTTEQCEQARDAIKLFPNVYASSDVLIACYAAQIPCADFDIVIFDECHHCAADTIASSLEGHAGIRWGLSATPDREDERREDVFKLIGPVVAHIERKELIEAGFITPARVIMHRIGRPNDLVSAVMADAEPEIEKAIRRYRFVNPDDLRKRIIWRHTQTRGIIEHLVRNHTIIDIARQHTNDSTLMIVSTVEHGERLKAHISESEVVHSKLAKGRRRKLLEMFSAGELQTLIATSLADEGLDVPRANVLILVAGGRSSRAVEQRTGRVLRTFAGKREGIIHDFYDMGHPYLRAQSIRREKIYRQLGYSLSEAC